MTGYRICEILKGLFLFNSENQCLKFSSRTHCHLIIDKSREGLIRLSAMHHELLKRKGVHNSWNIFIFDSFSTRLASSRFASGRIIDNR